MRTRRSLFEVMNKTPETQNPVVRSKHLLFWRKKEKPNGYVPVVAEPLTEEEAEAELAARQAAMEAEERARLEKEHERLARKAARKAEREAARRRAREMVASLRIAAPAAEAAEGEVPSAEEPALQVAPGRLKLSLSTTAAILGGAAVCVLLVGAYALGVRKGSSGTGADMARAAAVPGEDFADHADVQMVGDRSGPSTPVPSPAQRPTRIAPPPRAESAEIQTNAAAQLDSQAQVPVEDASKLNYLEIQWFAITRDKSSDQVLTELRDVQRFLAEKGIETFAQRLPNGFRLYGTRGFPMSEEHAKQREDYRRRVASFGREYRQVGGLYDWKDCYFVSYNRAVSGQPI